MNIAVILAGGTGSRLGLEQPKQFMKIAGKTILEHTVDIFQKHRRIDEIFVVMHHDHITRTEELVLKNGWTKVKKVLSGGSERYESSLVAINACNNRTKLNLLFHDAVRPMLNKNIIDATLDALEEYEAVDVAIPSADTIIELDETQQYIKTIPNRKFLRRGQTPQGFHYETIKKAYELALQDPDMQTTDDCGIVRKYLPDTPVYIVAGEEQNVKLTYPEDIYVLDKLFQIKSTAPQGNNLNKLNGKVMAVFGGNSGIGADMIKIAAEHGARCYAFSRSLTNTDVRDIDAVKRALQEVQEKESKIDFVVNSAAILNKEPIMHLGLEEMKRIIDINYGGMVNVSVAAYKYLKASRGQLLHFTSSSYNRGRANYALYSSSKAAVVNFVQAIAEEWQNDGIRINCINPQRTKTPMRVSNFGNEPENTLLKSKDVAEIALNTLLDDFSGEIVDIKL